MEFKHEFASDEIPRSGSRRALTIGVLLAIVALAGVGFASYFKRLSPVALTSYFIPKPQTYFGKDRIAVLVLGLDYNYDNKDEEYSSGARSDTIIAVGLNFPTDAHPKPSINVLSVLRDTDVTLPNGREDKINAAYSDGGPKFSEKAVSQFLGLPGFDRYVTLRVDATKQLINAIGGIDIVPDETMNYDDSWGHLHIHFIGGKKYHMNGEQAVSYGRFRHDECGDPCRVKRQQQVIRTVIAKLRNDRFNDLLHIRELIGVMNRNVTTDLRPDEQLSLATAFANLDLHDIKTDQVPFVGDKSLACCGDVLIADDAAKQRLVRKLFLDPLVPPAPVSRAAIAAVPASSISVDVLNGSGTPGLGRRLAETLRAKGFTVASVANADSFAYGTTEVHLTSSRQPLAGERVRLALSGLAIPSVQDDTIKTGAVSGDDVTVIVGRDYGAASQKEASATK